MRSMYNQRPENSAKDNSAKNMQTIQPRDNSANKRSRANLLRPCQQRAVLHTKFRDSSRPPSTLRREITPTFFSNLAF